MVLLCNGNEISWVRSYLGTDQFGYKRVWLQSLLISAGQVEVPAGQVNFRGSLPRSENNVLQPVLVNILICMYLIITFFKS